MFQRSAGILLHPTSLPGAHGIGDLGDAFAFADWLARAGMKWWQMLPLVPPGAGESPYSSWSAFAANPWLIDLGALARDGLLDLDDTTLPNGDHVDFGAAMHFKGPHLVAAADRLLAGHPLQDDLRAFMKENSWLADTGLFRALQPRFDHQPWWMWPVEFRDRDPKAIAAAFAENTREIEQFAAIQFFFERQWKALRAYCAERGIGLLGDVPFYVDANSADVWMHRELFEVDGEGRRLRVSGTPPDSFSETGQLWNNPLYRWDRMAADGFAWWKARLARALDLTDQVRLDHFRAFSAAWAVPGDAPDASGGEWAPGPGLPFFQELASTFGAELPMFAEDLGDIDDDVRALLAASGLPRMFVLQFGFGGDDGNVFLPHNHEQNGVAFTGTHDNDTTLGWWREVPENVREHACRYLEVDGSDIVWDLNAAALGSVCDLALIPMQDVLGLGSEARMNNPGGQGRNWAWRMEAPPPAELADRLRGLVEATGRQRS